MFNKIEQISSIKYGRCFKFLYRIQLVLGIICSLFLALFLSATPIKAASLAQPIQIKIVDVELRCYPGQSGDELPTTILATQIDSAGNLREFISLKSISPYIALLPEQQKEFEAVRSISDIRERQPAMVNYIEQYCPFSVALQNISSTNLRSSNSYSYRPELAPTLDQEKIIFNSPKNLVVFNLIVSVEWEPTLAERTVLKNVSQNVPCSIPCVKHLVSSIRQPMGKQCWARLKSTLVERSGKRLIFGSRPPIPSGHLP